MTFFLIPVITEVFPISLHSNFHLEPVLKNASATFLENHQIVHQQITQLNTSQSLLSINIILIFMYIIGFCIFLKKHIKNLLQLRQLEKNSFCQHKINNIHILFSSTTDIPFCWSLIKKHFIVIPGGFTF